MLSLPALGMGTTLASLNSVGHTLSLRHSLNTQRRYSMEQGDRFLIRMFIISSLPGALKGLRVRMELVMSSVVIALKSENGPLEEKLLMKLFTLASCGCWLNRVVL